MINTKIKSSLRFKANNLTNRSKFTWCAIFQTLGFALAAMRRWLDTFVCMYIYTIYIHM